MSMQMTTQLQQVITRYITRLTVGIISVDNTHDVPASFQIKALPTLVYHRKREIVARIVGACSRKLLESWLQKLMKQSNNLINH